MEVGFSGATDFGKKMTAVLSRNGDLVHKTLLRVQLPTVRIPANKWFRWLNFVGHVLVKSIELEIGGQRIDKHYGDWLHCFNELTCPSGHQLGYANLVGNIPRLTTPTLGPETIPGEVLYIPLQFFFCRNAGLALPLIALQYHEVKINVEFRDVKDCYWAADAHPTTPTIPGEVNMSAVTVPPLESASLFVDYIFLDSDERRRFAQSSHEYLIEQLQYSGPESVSSASPKLRLSLNHPTKVLIFTVQPDSHVADSAPYGKQWFNYTDTYDETAMIGFQPSGAMNLASGGANAALVPVYFQGKNPVATARIQLNGHDRLSDRDAKYYGVVQPYHHYENVPSTGVLVYSFALKPSEHQPSGSANFSRIDTATLNLTLTPEAVAGNRTCKVRVWAVNYNVLRLLSGMGGLAYSN